MQTKPRTRLQRERERQHFSQEDVAEKLDTTVRSVSRWESGESTPKPYYRMRLCELYGKKADELDLEPLEPELIMELENALYDPTIPARSSLPLFGRERVVQQIKLALLQNDDVAIYGFAGIGKSALAVALAYDQDIRQHFTDGILWSALGPSPDIARILARWKAFLLHTQPTFPKATTVKEVALDLRMHIGQARYLVVIDDAWSLKEALTLRAGSANCVYLYTTRFPGIALYLARISNVMKLEELSEKEGMNLLMYLAPVAVTQEQQQARHLVKVVGGHPLALTLLGNYLRVEAHSQQPRRIRAALRTTDVRTAEQRLYLEEERGPYEQHTSLPPETKLSLHAVISIGFQRLTEKARTALFALSVFPTEASLLLQKRLHSLLLTARPRKLTNSPTLICFLVWMKAIRFTPSLPIAHENIYAISVSTNASRHTLKKMYSKMISLSSKCPVVSFSQLGEPMYTLYRK